eukprot:CAMPEP_0113935960 /NCGR_PEP_ID=MMETSP1339-20121228/2972_1 /TAXON_ID=94617 /ORGANISM="Fibrocapsa japonica" /LENGTH=277 /DNA_ID=CAMNT_0000938267 /DNA_START=123 /DNA_END=956 /DNA_ORIENTATION=+ /assembly_acc=CAM_ASM_000762
MCHDASAKHSELQQDNQTDVPNTWNSAEQTQTWSSPEQTHTWNSPEQTKTWNSAEQTQSSGQKEEQIQKPTSSSVTWPAQKFQSPQTGSQQTWNSAEETQSSGQEDERIEKKIRFDFTWSKSKTVNEAFSEEPNLQPTHEPSIHFFSSDDGDELTMMAEASGLDEKEQYILSQLLDQAKKDPQAMREDIKDPQKFMHVFDEIMEEKDRTPMRGFIPHPGREPHMEVAEEPHEEIMEFVEVKEKIKIMWKLKKMWELLKFWCAVLHDKLMNRSPKIIL